MQYMHYRYFSSLFSITHLTSPLLFNSGFGNQAAAPKIIKTSKTNGKKSFVGIGKPDKPINDFNKPEYDDQGYTL